MINDRMTKYEAPEGVVFDWKEPHTIMIDGQEQEEHLYAKYLFLTRIDSIDNYILVEEPK